jgi:hypothetical protein
MQLVSSGSRQRRMHAPGLWPLQGGPSASGATSACCGTPCTNDRDQQTSRLRSALPLAVVLARAPAQPRQPLPASQPASQPDGAMTGSMRAKKLPYSCPCPPFTGFICTCATVVGARTVRCPMAKPKAETASTSTVGRSLREGVSASYPLSPRVGGKGRGDPCNRFICGTGGCHL